MRAQNIECLLLLKIPIWLLKIHRLNSILFYSEHVIYRNWDYCFYPSYLSLSFFFTFLLFSLSTVPGTQKWLNEYLLINLPALFCAWQQSEIWQGWGRDYPCGWTHPLGDRVDWTLPHRIQLDQACCASPETSGQRAVNCKLFSSVAERSPLSIMTYVWGEGSPVYMAIYSMASNLSFVIRPGPVIDESIIRVLYAGDTT